jgi:hypothetical protein
MNGILYITGALADGGVTTAKIAADAVTGAKIADDAINSEHYTDGSIDTAHIADAQITTTKIADSQIITAKINNSAVTTAKIADDAVTNAKLASNSVTNAKVAGNAISSATIIDGNVTTAKIADDAVTTAKIADDAITNAKIADNAIQTVQIAVSQVTSNRIADQAVTLDKLPHGTGSNDGKFLRANNGADPSFETVTSTTINNNADNRVITGSGTANTLEGEANLTYDGTRLNVGTGDLAVTGAEGGDAQLRLTADEGDDGADYWRLESKASDNKFNLATYASGAWVDKVTVDSSGNVGIGTTSPAKNLHVANSGVATVRIETTDSRGQAWDLLSTNGSQNNTGTLSFRDESGSSYLEFGANGGSPKLTVRNGGANDLLHIDNNGNVTKPRNAFAIIHSSSGDAGTTGNKIKDAYAVFTGVHLNQGSHYNTSNGRFTCPVDGVYGVAFSSNLHMSNFSIGNNINIQTRKNGAIQLYNYNTVVTTIWQQMTFTNYVNCNANDYLQIYYGGSATFGADQGSGQWGHLYFWLAQ